MDTPHKKSIGFSSLSSLRGIGLAALFLTGATPWAHAADLTVEGALHIDSYLDFGTTSEVTPRAAVTVSYGENGSVYTTQVSATRDQAGFLWTHNAGGTAKNKMNLAADNVLSLYDAASGAAKITLNPNTGKITLGTGGGIVLPDGTLVSGISNFRSTALYDASGNPKLTVDANGKLLFSGGAASFGNGTTASGNGSASFGDYTNAIGNYSASLGRWTYAEGLASASFGSSTHAFGQDSASFGSGSEATGDASASFGTNTYALGPGSASFGSYTFAEGSISASFGFYTHAPGMAAASFGGFTYASGEVSASFGNSTVASGYASATFGQETYAEGEASACFGWGTCANGPAQLVIGQYNNVEYQTGTYDTWDLYNWPDTLEIFVIGNGSDTHTLSNAFVVRRNGNTEISGDLIASGDDNTLPNQTLSGTGSILTQGLADGRYLKIEDVATGAGAVLTETEAAGAYLTISNATSSYLPITTAGNTYLTITNATSTYLTQDDAADDYLTKQEAAETYLPISSAEAAYLTKSDAVATYLTPTSGDTLFLTQTEGDSRYALIGSVGGGGSIDPTHVAFGNLTVASGQNAVSMGDNTTAQGAAQVVLGRFNEPQGDPQNWVETDDLFVIGNGSDSNNRANAMVVKKNGDASFQGNVTISGEAIITRVAPQGDILMGEFGN